MDYGGPLEYQPEKSRGLGKEETEQVVKGCVS